MNKKNNKKNILIKNDYVLSVQTINMIDANISALSVIHVITFRGRSNKGYLGNLFQDALAPL